MRRLTLKRTAGLLAAGFVLVVLIIAGIAGISSLVNAVFAPLIELALRLLTPA